MPALTIHIFCLLIAFFVFLAAALPLSPRVNLIAVGLAFLTLAFLFP